MKDNLACGEGAQKGHIDKNNREIQIASHET